MKRLSNEVNKVNDPEVNKIISCGKKQKKMFHALHKADMHTCYSKQKINLACPDTGQTLDYIITSHYLK